ncbi:MAG: sulfurtransferase TusA family protein [Candidatus Sericytochromatia bacterium]|nr:sulfurtransferase TusA family protein [Candidatus Sericytochromatia bacterium]
MSDLQATKVLDAQGLKCPMPIVKAKKELDTLSPGDVLKVVATDKGSVLDFQGWARTNKFAELLGQETEQAADGTERYLHFLRRK